MTNWRSGRNRERRRRQVANGVGSSGEPLSASAVRS
jgi:hypothetical protein